MITLIEQIQKQVQLKGERTAYQIGENKITYQELWKKAEHFSSLLKKQDSTPVILYGDNSVLFVVTILSCILAERPYVPIGKCTPISRLKEIIKLTEASLVITKEEIELEIPVLHSLEELEQFKENPEIEFHNDTIYMIFTSGSTGTPKGVPISRENLNNFMNWLNHLEPFSTYNDCMVYNQANFSFDLSVADFYYSLCNGHTLVDLEEDIQENFESFLKAFQEIDVAFLTPTYSKLCLLDKDFDEKHFPTLKCIYFCGEVLDKKVVEKCWERFPNLTIVNAYGPTEATSAVSAITITKDMLQEEKLPIGIDSSFATEIEIIDDEIVLKGKSVFSGYLGKVSGGYYKEEGVNCYKTGDIGTIQNHKLYYKGRIDNQIKFKGYRIELEEIDYHIKSIKGVNDCATIAILEDDKVKTIKSFVTGNVTKEEIQKELEKKTPVYMIPKTIQIVEELPVSCNKKIDRKALIEL